MELGETERIDDLQFKGLKLIQDKTTFCFGVDAVLLSDYAKDAKESSVIVDFCSGNGIVPILLSGKTNAEKIYGIEIQEEIANLAKRNVELNKLENKIEIINKNLLEIDDKIKAGSVDIVTVNPPYKKKGSGIINEKDTLTIARHEISCTLEEIIAKASKILKSGGKFFMVHRPERLVDICYAMRKNKLEPKRIKMIYPSPNKAPNLILVEGVRSANSFLKVEEPLYIYDTDGNYTKELKQIYSIEEE